MSIEKKNKVVSKMKIHKVIFFMTIFITCGIILILSLYYLIESWIFPLEIGYWIKETILLIGFIYSGQNLRMLKSLCIDDEYLTVNYPFRFNLRKIPKSYVKEVKQEIIKSSGGSGPGYIDYPEFRLIIYLTDQTKIKLSSKFNTDLDEIKVHLDQ